MPAMRPPPWSTTGPPSTWTPVLPCRICIWAVWPSALRIGPPRALSYSAPPRSSRGRMRGASCCSAVASAARRWWHSAAPSWGALEGCMSEGPVVGMDGLAALRSAFDGTFVAPPRSRQERYPVIQIRLGGEVFAVRAAHIAGLVKSRKIVPLPSRIPELLGVSALRGSLIPVYDLAALLGIPPAVSGPSWLMLAPGETPIGLAFDGFEGR